MIGAPAGLMRISALALATLALARLAGPASALVDGGGAPVPNTSTANRTDQLAAPPSLRSMLARPGSPDDDDPAVLARLGSPNNPENDLADALDALAVAPDAAAAAAARSLALDILEGNPVAAKAYSGIPLLNWNVPAKVKTVPAGGNVEVTQVRFGDHTLTDTWLLDFADPTKPFSITYRVAELDPAGLFAPTPLLADQASPIGGMHSVAEPLVLPNLLTGTSDVSPRFHPEGPAPERTRLGIQDLTVAMPPPALSTAILHPDLRPDHLSLATLEPATPERVARARASFGFGDAPATEDQKLAAIERLAPAAPEKLIWSDLRRLDPAAPDFVAATHAVAAQDRQLVAPMRTRNQLPPGVVAPAGADVVVALVNNEAYVAKRARRLPRSFTLAVVNADGFAHRLQVAELSGQKPVFGAIDWGQFDWRTLVPAGPGSEVAPGQSRTFTVTPAGNSFQLWVGDPDSGDQAGMVLPTDRGPDQQSFRIDPNFALPEHDAEDKDGNVWVTLHNVDKVAKLNPADDLSASAYEEYLLPGGNVDPTSATPSLHPHDIAVDGHGMVWVTVVDGNAIARIDPARTRPGTSDGITVYPLDACGTACTLPPPPPPGAPVEPPTRGPEQMALLEDGDGNTVVWFSELSASAIGVLRVAPDGTRLAGADYPCGCGMPKGIALAGDGSVWFTELHDNRIGHLRPDQSRPYDAATARVEHFNIPSGVVVVDPALPAPFVTSGPHSVALDGEGRVWFTEEETGKVAYLLPSRARPDTTEGFTELPLPANDFNGERAPADIAVDRAGTVYFSDEYGDSIGSVTAAGPGPQWRPTARNSLTDKPMADSAGNLWFTEAGANLVTRISGVTAGSPRPDHPAVFEADTTAGTVSGRMLREVQAVDVEVVRGGQTVARATGVPVTGGSFAVGGGGRPWTTAAGHPVGPADLVRVMLHAGAPRAPLSFTVATLEAVVHDDGSVTGVAVADDRALADHVHLDVAGVARDVPVDPADGRFRLAPAGLDRMTANGTVSWSGATAAGVFRTVTGFPPPAPPAPVAPPPPPPTPPAPPTPVPAPRADGYWVVGADGGLFAFGDAPFLGSTGAIRLNQPVVGMAATRSGRGYWLAGSDGAVFAFGDAPFLGSAAALRLNKPVVAMAGTPSGGGYWLVAADGAVFAFGDAGFFGSTSDLPLRQPVVGVAPTRSGHGYWLVAADGGIFAFGDARFAGSTGGERLNQPIVGMTPTPAGTGYWLVARDGGIFAFGDAPFLGSTGAIRINHPAVGMTARFEGGGR